jgi:hemoglobin
VIEDPTAVPTDDPTADLTTPEHIEQLVRAFYRDVATDDLLGPIFAGVDVDWPSHVDKLTDFWAWQILGIRGYDGNPLRAHEPVHERFTFTEAHFDRWLELFTAHVDRSFAGPNAELATQRATKMATAMRRLLDGRHGAADEPITPLLVPRREVGISRPAP